MTFLELGWEVMRRRTKDGVRGVDREWSRWRLHVATAAFASRPVAEIATRDVREWLRIMIDKPALGPGEKRTLARQTVARCQSLVSAVFVEAIERDLRDDNPSLSAKLKKRADARDTRDKWAFLSADEQRLVHECAAVPYEDRLMIRINIFTGMRQGEMRHLPIDCVKLDAEPPFVELRIANRDKEGNPLPTKSGKSRKVPLFKEGLAAMREWLGMLPAYAPENPYAIVFPTRAGRYRQQGKFFGRSGTLRGYYAAAGVRLRPYLHHHALRHTYATNLITGVFGRPWRLEEIQKVLGHSSITMTERYAHLGEDAIKRAARETEATVAISPLPPDTIRDLNAVLNEEAVA